jgi:hypothetical protein
MMHENEIIMLLLGIIIFFFILKNKLQIRRIYAWKLLLSSYGLLFAGWIFTVLEGFLLESYLNILEHLSYSCSAIILAFWCWKVVYRSKVEG